MARVKKKFLNYSNLILRDRIYTNRGLKEKNERQLESVCGSDLKIMLLAWLI